MAVTITKGTSTKPVSSTALVQFFSVRADLDGDLFIGYPIINTIEGRLAIDALWVSPSRGVVIFDLVEGADAGDYESRQDDVANSIESRLKAHRNIVSRRELLIPVSVVTLAVRGEYREFGDYPIVGLEGLDEYLGGISWHNNSDVVFKAALSAVQNISTIRKSRIRRNVLDINSRGAKLKSLEESIATLDIIQSKAVVETVDGVQRIRGLAGSGKTIVLALKAAYLHAQHPDWKIAVTFNTRSLKGQFRRLINNFSLEQTGDEPNWDNLRIINAWGAPGGRERDGIYHEFCRMHDVAYLDYKAAQSAFGDGRAFSGACRLAIDKMRQGVSVYDAILVDEAQDFPAAFLRLCYELLGDEKRLVYAYDELQNLGGESLPPPEEIFGSTPSGVPRVRFDSDGSDGARQDIILEKCYRNSRPVLVTAHALGFGIYRTPPRKAETGLIQMFEHAHLWEEIGYKVRSGALEDGADVVLYRSSDTSPRFLEEHSSPADLVFFKAFSTYEEQDEWVARQIVTNIEKDELRHEDIVVINPDPLTTRKKVGKIRRLLLDAGVNSHLAGVDTDPDVFFQTETPSVTFTGIYRAKGNEAGMVYIINAHDCHSSMWNLATIRNRLFTAITRSKAWVRVLGVGEGMMALLAEFEALQRNDYELRFRYPTRVEREQLQIVHRDMSEKERRLLEQRQKDLSSLVSELEQGKVKPQDLDDDLLDRLKQLLSGRS